MERLRELRLQRGMTQTQVGDLIGVSCVTVGRYEAGEREPSNAKISALADYFGVSIDYLMGRDETEKELSADEKKRKEIIEAISQMPLEKLEALAVLLQKNKSGGQ